MGAAVAVLRTIFDVDMVALTQELIDLSHPTHGLTRASFFSALRRVLHNDADDPHNKVILNDVFEEVVEQETRCAPLRACVSALASLCAGPDQHATSVFGVYEAAEGGLVAPLLVLVAWLLTHGVSLVGFSFVMRVRDCPTFKSHPGGHMTRAGLTQHLCYVFRVAQLPSVQSRAAQTLLTQTRASDHSPQVIATKIANIVFDSFNAAQDGKLTIDEFTTWLESVNGDASTALRTINDDADTEVDASDAGSTSSESSEDERFTLSDLRTLTKLEVSRYPPARGFACFWLLLGVTTRCVCVYACCAPVSVRMSPSHKCSRCSMARHPAATSHAPLSSQPLHRSSVNQLARMLSWAPCLTRSMSTLTA